MGMPGSRRSFLSSAELSAKLTGAPCDREEKFMRLVLALSSLVLLSGCLSFSSSNPPPPQQNTVVVPQRY
jgi:hypothetical protein